MGLVGAVSLLGCGLEPLRTIDVFGAGSAASGACNQVRDGGQEAPDDAGDSDGGLCGGDFVAPPRVWCGHQIGDGDMCPVALGEACYQTCGPLGSGVETCVCSTRCPAGSTSSRCLVCQPCRYNPAGSYACFRLPAIEAARCPATEGADAGTVVPGEACGWAACHPCAATYRDSTRNVKEGYCVCDECKGSWSCATKGDWPKACATGR